MEGVKNQDAPSKALLDGTPSDIVRQYHERTKHSFYAYAKGPETLDWDGQPNPFRNFVGAETFPLSLQDSLAEIRYFDIFNAPLVATPITLSSISSFLRYSLGLSAWKQYGPDKWSLRVNPSSGNLHPTEAYVLLPDVINELGMGLFHYNVEQHLLEKRADISKLLLPENTFCIALTSVIWRELWKYGERGFRYTQLDVGHAINAIVLSAKAHGWQVAMFDGLDTLKLSELLGLAREEYSEVEKELSECLLLVGRDISQAHESYIEFDSPEVSTWHGRPSRLGERSFYQWPWAEKVADASLVKTENITKQLSLISDVLSPIDYRPNSTGVEADRSFAQATLQRRSAQKFDKSFVSYGHFRTLVESLLSFSQPVFTENISPINFVIMIHRVEGIEPGIYILPSHSSNMDALKSACTKWPEWTAMSEFGANKIPMYQLKVANVQKAAQTLCCQQAIASECAFTLGFLADFDQTIDQFGASSYRHLYWQAGMLSQQAYMSSTALHLAATGIGCFFDDPWLGLLGIESSEVQMLYATAVGHPMVDQRITSFSGYYHLSERL
jgi:SagB-type dehydrogenase family enzyme